MARINTNIASLIAQSNLARSSDDLNVRLQRLSTGLRINRGADDPAGLIVSERLRSEMKSLDQAIRNSERASSVIATTEGYLAEVTDLLNSIKSLVVEAANTGGLSKEEIDANQLQIDSAIESITRISNTASFAGLQLLNGSLDYLTSGVDPAAIDGLNVFSAQFGTASSMPVDVNVVASARTGSLYHSGGAGTLVSSITLEIAGNKGVQSLSFASGTTMTEMATAINLVKESTGVSAALFNPAASADGIQFFSTAYGSDQFVSIKKIGDGGSFDLLTEPGGVAANYAIGRDVTAIVNGAVATGKGLKVSLNAPTLSIELVLSEALGTSTSNTSFDLTGGGVNFQLGPSINATQQVGYGIQSVAASRLGGTTIDGVRYYLDSLRSGQANAISDGQSQNAAEILDNAITEISVVRGRLGAFERNTVQTNIRSLQVGLENITASESTIRDTDFARETAALTRAQILTQAGTAVLATANVSAQNVLSLLS